MAEQKPYLTGRSYIFRINKGKDLLEALTDFCHDNQIKCGILSGVGALETATITCYNQTKKVYDKKTIAKPTEILAINGNISIMDNRSNVQATLTLSHPDGVIEGGRLAAGSKVFIAEVFIQELVGDPKVRKQDKITKLNLWI